jgi:peptidoglycan pentaglycine glycine transferase (the first glycine)
MSLSVEESHNPAQWDALVKQSGGHPLQLWGWGELKSAHRWRAERLIVRDGDTVVGLAQILSRALPKPFPKFVYCPRGPIVLEAATGDVADAIAEHVQATRKALAVSLEPDETAFQLGRSWRRAKNHVLPARTLILDLQQSEDDLIAAMSKKHRQYIRKSEREPSLTIRPVTTMEQLEQCLEVYKDTAQRAEFGLHELSYYTDAFTLLGENAAIWASYEQDKPVAFLWVTMSDRTSFELYGGMDARGQALRANYALKWNAIKHMKSRGVHRYDFGGLINDGVTTFKTGFAGHEDELVGTWDLPLSPLYPLWSSALPRAKKMLRWFRR